MSKASLLKMKPKFGVDEIRKLRDANSARHLKMSYEEIRMETSEKANQILEKLNELRKKK